ncbi:MAG: hypothetical protein OHK0038_15420 [Flammeovirgaceae bacterium]
MSEVKNKLSDFKISQLEKDEIIDFLVQEKYLDEERYAHSFVRGKIRHNHWGKIKVRYELQQKQIPNSIIQKALSSIEEEEYIKILRKVLETKSINLREKEKLEKKSKLIHYALQKGFESNLILDLVEEFIK